MYIFLKIIKHDCMKLTNMQLSHAVISLLPSSFDLRNYVLEDYRLRRSQRREHQKKLRVLHMDWAGFSLKIVAR